MIHDRYQAEVNVNYSLMESESLRHEYEIETYIFAPKSLGVNRHTFSKSNFYKSIQNFIRLKASSVLLEDLTGFGRDYLGQIKSAIIKYEEDDREVNFTQLSQNLKLFCCSFESSLRKRRRKVIKNLPNNKFAPEAREYLAQSTTMVQNFREMRKLLIKRIKGRKLFNLIDEYLSYIVYTNAFKLLSVLKNKKNLQNNDLEVLRGEVLRIIQGEFSYGKASQFLLPSNEGTNEEYVYRNKVILKKPIWGILHLDIDKRDEGGFREHIILSLAAGISMVVATLLAFYFQKRFGNFTFPFFVALVLGYMAKDRIKEALRIILTDKILSKTVDKNTKIFSHSGSKIGHLTETFSFQSKSELPKEVFEMREKNRDEDIHRDNSYDENVLVYKKKVKLNPKKFRQSYDKLHAEGIKDLIRFNITPFLYRMDNPIHYAHGLTEDGEEMERIKCHRVYHINFVLKFSDRVKESLDRYRIVLNRKGILNIEREV